MAGAAGQEAEATYTGELIFRHPVRVSLAYADPEHPSKKTQGLSTVPSEDLREQSKGERVSLFSSPKCPPHIPIQTHNHPEMPDLPTTHTRWATCPASRTQPEPGEERTAPEPEPGQPCPNPQAVDSVGTEGTREGCVPLTAWQWCSLPGTAPENRAELASGHPKSLCPLLILPLSTSMYTHMHPYTHSCGVLICKHILTYKYLHAYILYSNMCPLMIYLNGCRHVIMLALLTCNWTYISIYVHVLTQSYICSHACICACT